jgi:acetoin utilization deacetylase AcuC-like enzyme
VKRLYYSDQYEIPLPPGHKFPVRKYRLLRETLAACGLFRIEPAPQARPPVIELAHDADYVRHFLEGSLSAAEMRRIGFPWSEGLVRRTLASVGGTLAAADDALASGFGGTLSGGTHHAARSAGSGFCVFNDIAVAIRRLQSQHRIVRAAVIDLDVHQGDGTAGIFAGEPRVLTLSIHARNNFPFRKQDGDIDVDLPDATGDVEYLAALERVLPSAFEFAPDIVFYQSGVDALASDRLGKLSLSHAGLAERDRMVFERCRSHGAPVVVTLGGGYSEPVELTMEAHAATFLTAAAVFRDEGQSAR